ncbi:metallophosphoesterase [Ignavigranum ruoffiae]|uniref:metallophosphoesterase n=1 Tax=Ignavigranum ruoffiae TaxID=89093 RepID=UPI0023546B59|nr:metallophosphoesterase [Ignavigranum ruoffiae]
MIRIAATTDIHGFLDRGLYELAKPSFRAGTDIFIDNGDFFTGSPLASYFARTDQISPLVNVANDLAFDAMVIGNHDLDYGLAWLKTQVAALEMPYLAANVFDRSGQACFNPYIIREIRGFKVAMIGVLNSECRQTMPRAHSLKVFIEDPLTSVGRLIDQLEERVDLILVAYHGGLIKDMKQNRLWTYPNQADQAHEFLESYPAVKGLICGHQHFTYSQIIPSGQAIIQAGSQGSCYGELLWSEQGGWLEARIHPLKDHPWPLEDRQAFADWFHSPADNQDGLQTLREIFPDQWVYWDLSAETWADLYQAIPQPFSIAKYLFNKEEFNQLIASRGAHLLPAQAADVQGDFKEVLSLAGNLPSKYCRQRLIFPLFDFLVNSGRYMT